MEKGIEMVAQMAYPGRIVIVGTSPAGDGVVIYAVTGRSPSSQARTSSMDLSRARSSETGLRSTAALTNGRQSHVSMSRKA